MAPAVDAYLCSYPKSGRTWMRFALSNLMDEVYGLGLDLDMENMFGLIPNDDGRKQTQAWKTLDAYRFAERNDVPFAAMSHLDWEERFATTPVVLLMRTPADSLVSRYYHMSRHAGQFKDDIDAFAHDPRYGVPGLVEYFASWEPHAEDPNVVAVTYEQLRSEPLEPFGRIVAQLGIEATAAQMEAALEMSSVDRMREVERRSGVGQPNDYDRNDPQAMRVRKARVGGWREELSPETTDYLLGAFAQSESASALLERYSIVPQVEPA
jgi:hypothetical protein